MKGTPHKVFASGNGYRIGWPANVVITETGEAAAAPAGNPGHSGRKSVAQLIAENAEQLWIIDDRGPLFKTQQAAQDAIEKLEDSP